MESDFSEGKMHVSYVVREGHTGMQVGHQILPALMHQAVDERRPDWRRIALDGGFGPNFASIRAGMEAGFKSGTVQYVGSDLARLPLYSSVFVHTRSVHMGDSAAFEKFTIAGRPFSRTDSVARERV
jgi:hypothetical protein